MILTVVTCITGLILYFYINRPGNYSLNGDLYATEMDIGKFINAHIDPNEVVFAEKFEISPQIVFYAHRNIKEVGSADEAMKFLSNHPIKQGVLFQVDSSGAIKFERLNAP